MVKNVHAVRDPYSDSFLIGHKPCFCFGEVGTLYFNKYSNPRYSFLFVIGIINWNLLEIHVVCKFRVKNGNFYIFCGLKLLIQLLPELCSTHLLTTLIMVCKLKYT